MRVAKKPEDREAPVKGKPLISGAPRGKGVVYTLAQRALHTAAAEQLLVQAIGTPRLVQRMLRKQFGIGPRRAASVVAEVLDGWAAGIDPRQTQKNRVQAIARVRRDLHKARYVLRDGKWVERACPKFSAIARLEHLLMRLEGTDQPVKHDVDVRMNEAAIGSIAKLTAQQVREILARGEETERLADAARRRLPDITVEAEVAE